MATLSETLHSSCRTIAGTEGQFSEDLLAALRLAYNQPLSQLGELLSKYPGGLQALLQLGAAPSLGLNFAADKALDSRITFTRASSATYFDVEGTLQTASTNTPRFDHDPTTHKSLGLLIEEARTNLLTYSEQFDNAAWNKTRSSVSAPTVNSVVAPDGLTTADKLVEDSTVGNSHYIYQIAAVTSGTAYTWSCFVKAEERANVAIQFFNTNSAFVTAVANFDLSAGTVTNQDAGVSSASISAVGGGWYRISASAAATASAFGFIRLFLGSAVNTISYSGDGVSGVYLWGAQLEAGAFATSYIPTAGAAATRSTDVASMTGANFSSWYNQSEGTFVASTDVASLGDTGGLWSVGDSTLAFGARNSIYATSTITSGLFGVSMAVSGVSQLSASATPGTFVPNAQSTCGLAYKANDTVGAFDGSVGTTDTSCSVPSGANGLGIGILDYGWSSGGNHLNGHIASIAYYATRLSNTALQGLSQ